MSIDGFAVIVIIAGALSTIGIAEPSKIVADADATLITLPLSAASCPMR